MLNERFGFSKKMDDESANAIWQCPEILTCQAFCKIQDTRTEEWEDFTVFYTLDDADRWKHELTRIVSSLGYVLGPVMDHWIRKTTLDSYGLHCKGTAVE